MVWLTDPISPTLLLMKSEAWEEVRDQERRKALGQ